ncbi:FAS1 domain-containing protein [Fennellomyces sp. T-0311]|nr:FAS1 domain-containing protein [Fennellomyces sp. T-0311]
MLIGKLLAIGVLGAASVHAQMTNTTLLGILNTTQLSPANKFMELLVSDPKYKPLLNLLSSPGNYTVFVPSDKAFEQMNETSTDNDQQPQEEGSGGQEPPSDQQGGDQQPQEEGSGDQQPPSDQQGGDQQPQEEGSGDQQPPDQQDGGGQQQQNAAFRALYAMLPKDLRILQQENSTDSNNGTNNSTKYNPFQEGPLQNYTVNNLIQYHILNGTHLLKDLHNNTVLHTTLTNRTVDKNGIGLPLVIIQRNATDNSTSDNSTDSEEQQQAYRVLQQQGNSTTNGTSANETEIPKEFLVGNGLNFSNVTLYDIRASNGVLHVIDKVLIPPGNATDVIQNVSDTQTLAHFAQQNQSAANQFNNAHNITVFAPSDEAFQQAGINSGIQILEALRNFQSQPSDIQQLVKSHIVPGVYYANNLTQIANRTRGGHSIKNENGGNIYLSRANQTTVRGMCDPYLKRHPNILLDNGVMHVIDGSKSLI